MSVKRVRDPTGIFNDRLVASFENMDDESIDAAIMQWVANGDALPRIEQFAAKRNRLRDRDSQEWFDQTLRKLRSFLDRNGETSALHRRLVEAEKDLIIVLQQSRVKELDPGLRGRKNLGVPKPGRRSALTRVLEYLIDTFPGTDNDKLIEKFRDVKLYDDFQVDTFELGSVADEERVVEVTIEGRKVSRAALQKSLSRAKKKIMKNNSHKAV